MRTPIFARPLPPTAAAFALGCAAGPEISRSVALVALAASTTLAAWALPRAPRTSLASIALAFCAAGAAASRGPPELRALPGETSAWVRAGGVVEGRVLEAPRSRGDREELLL